MKNLNFKIKFILTTLIICSVVGTKAQWCGTVPTQNAQNQVASQPSTCVRQLLDDMIPKSNDRTIDVNVNFWVFTPTYMSSLTAVWTHSANPTTSLSALACLAVANSVYTNVPSTPKLTVPGITVGIPYPKIRLVLKTFTVVHNDLPYLSVGTAENGTFGHSWFDPNAINVFLGTETQTTIATSNTGTYIASNYIHGTIAVANGIPATPGVDNIVHFNPEFYFTLLPDGSRYDNIAYYGKELAHEVGHILGLNHPTGPTGTNPNICLGEPYSCITPTFGCCTYQECNDHPLETYTCSTNNPTATAGNIIITQQNCSVPGASDNLMSQNSGCNRYLSPQQIAVMHYNLRTLQTSFLTASGYTAALNANLAFNYDVTSNETWTTDRYFKGDITVKAGKILTINCAVAMSAGAKIIVEKTAALVVNGGTITNISGRSWDGIYVWGDPVKSQALNPSNTNLAQFQGWVKLYNATISHAKIGVRNHNNPWSENGGIITAFNTNFLNNYIDIEQIGPSSTPSGLASASRFYNCNFKTNTDIGDNLSPYAHVNLYRSVGAAFYGCNFEYAAGTVYNNPGYGIYSVNSKFTADKNGATPNVFKDLDRGVYVNNWNPLNVPSISNSKFINNTGYGAYFMNANTLVFQKNLVQNPGNYMAWSGVYLNNCKYYTIKSNTFTEDLNNKASVALSIYNSSSGTHQVYRNSFAKSWIGINAMGNNSGLSNTIDGLKMNCNDFTPTANLYDIALDLGNGSIAPSVMRDQGIINGQNTSFLVRNMYAATCVGNNQNKWYIHSSSSKAINHGCNATSSGGASTKPSPQPACSRAIVNTPTITTVLNYTLDCSETNPSSGGTGTTQAQRLSTMNGYLSELLANNTDNKNHFEIQATLASKLNLFLSDSLNNGQDSVITLLNNNQGSMQDADIQTVFAYMAVGNYTEAQSKVDNLQNKTDWAALLAKLIQVEQYDGGAMSMTSTDREFFVGYATTEGKDGQSIAQAVLKAGDFNSYSEPHNYPENLEGARFTGQQTLLGSGKGDEDNTLERITIYPNPTKTGINIFCTSVKEGNYKIEIQDLLGRVIYTNFITGNLIKQYVPFDGLNKGMYLITISRNDEIINKTKIIKED